MIRLLMIGGLGATTTIWALTSALQAYEGGAFWSSPASLLDYLNGEKADLFVRWTTREGYGALPALAFLGTLATLAWQVGGKKAAALVAAILLGCTIAMGLSPVAQSIGIIILGGLYSLLGMGFASLWVTGGVLALLGLIGWGLGWVTIAQAKRLWAAVTPTRAVTASAATPSPGVIDKFTAWLERRNAAKVAKKAEQARLAAEAEAAAAARQAELDAELAPLRAMAAEELAAIEAKAKADRDAMLAEFKADSEARMEELQRELEKLLTERTAKRAKRKAAATPPEAPQAEPTLAMAPAPPAKPVWEASPIGMETLRSSLTVTWGNGPTVTAPAAPPPAPATPPAPVVIAPPTSPPVVAPPVVVTPPVAPQMVLPSASKPEEKPATQPRSKGGKFAKAADTLADLGKAMAEKGMVPIEPAPASPKVELKQAMRSLPQADFKAFRNALSVLQRNGVDLSSADAFHFVVNGDVEAKPKNPKPLQKVFAGRAFSDEQREAFKATLQALKVAGATLPTDYEALTV